MIGSSKNETVRTLTRVSASAQKQLSQIVSILCRSWSVKNCGPIDEKAIGKPLSDVAAAIDAI